MGWLKSKYPHVFDDTPFSRKKYPGHTSCDPGFILAYLEARDKAYEEKKTVAIKGYNYSVSMSKDKE